MSVGSLLDRHKFPDSYICSDVHEHKKSISVWCYEVLEMVVEWSDKREDEKSLFWTIVAQFHQTM